MAPLPEPRTASQVTAALDVLSRKSEQLSEQLNAAGIALKRAQAASLLASKAASTAHTAKLRAERNLGVSLAAQYRASSFSHTAALLSSDSGQGYLDALQSMNLIAAHQAEVARLATTASARALVSQRVAAVAKTAAQSQRDALAKNQDALGAQVAKYNRLLQTLTAAARVTFYAATAAPAAQVQQLTVSPVVVHSKGAAAAIAAARAQLGKPYVYGASGPGAFDCSGLTAWAWSAAGVSLPHNAAAQYGYGTHVPQNQLQPGDLVFFYSPISHVGIYIGDGLMIHAPTSGDVVKISAVFAMGDYVGATRLG